MVKEKESQNEKAEQVRAVFLSSGLDVNFGGRRDARYPFELVIGQLKHALRRRVRKTKRKTRSTLWLVLSVSMGLLKTRPQRSLASHLTMSSFSAKRFLSAVLLRG